MSETASASMILFVEGRHRVCLPTFWTSSRTGNFRYSVCVNFETL